ncbi:hypothetical protein ALO43_200106 [Pseudomonas tremae]|uniref:Uncharacterized protein n=1 Tax=Pseudomonas tremae TaxID=200454 RepID=A0AA40NZP1_9PSED|nr:hypothetical protein ALO43_200106 [Pseudomonas tremae]
MPQAAGRSKPPGIALRLKFADESFDGLGMLRKIQHRSAAECVSAFTRHTTQTMTGEQAFKCVEHPQLRVAFALPGFKQP